MPTFSFSQYQTFLTCPKKYYWSYIRGLVPKTTPKAYLQGAAFHEGVAGLPGDTLFHLIGQLARRHFQPMPNQRHEVSKTIEIDPGLQLVCIADALSDNHVIEYKTMSRPDADTINAQLLSAQLRLYAIVFGKPKVLVRIARKAEIRLKKGESDEQFNARYIQEYIDKPSEYFLELEVEVGKPGTIREMMHTVGLIRSCENAGLFPCNAPYACYGRYACSYMPLCVDEATNIMLFEEKEKKNATPY
jgi:hypothetical protein